MLEAKQVVLHLDLLMVITLHLLVVANILFGIDDYSRFAWIYFLEHNQEILQVFMNFYKSVRKKKGIKINRILRV